MLPGKAPTLRATRSARGRLLDRVGAGRLLAAGTALSTASIAVTGLPAPAAAPGGPPGIGLSGIVAIGGMVLVGLATAPIFPLLTLTTGDRVGAAGTGTAVGAQVAASSVGGAGLPILMGILIGRYGGNALGPCLLVLAVLLVPLLLALRRPH